MVLTTVWALRDAILSKAGQVSDHWSVSFTIYASIVLSVNITVLFRCRSITWLTLVAIFLTSIFPYFLFMYWYDRWDWINVESSYSTDVLFKTIHFYLLVSINCMYVTIGEMLYLMKIYRMKPTLAEYFKLLIKIGKEDNASYFNNKSINYIKRFWNPLELKRATKEVQPEMFDQTYSEIDVSSAKNHLNNNARLSIVSNADSQGQDYGSLSNRKNIVDYNDCLMNQSKSKVEVEEDHEHDFESIESD